jgi:hypothetical protein
MNADITVQWCLKYINALNPQYFLPINVQEPWYVSEQIMLLVKTIAVKMYFVLFSAVNISNRRVMVSEIFWKLL